MTATDRDIVLAAVSDDVGRRLSIYVDLLARWQQTINLVASSTLADLWSRHVSDSLQVQAAIPTARRWVDLGSGGGFPGLITAIALVAKPEVEVHLVESDKRKAAFLSAAIRETGAPATVHAERIEVFVPSHAAPVDAVSARALASLPRLVAYADRFITAGAVGVFPKGQSAATELTGFDLGNKFAVESVPSRTDRSSCLFIVRARPG